MISRDEYLNVLKRFKDKALIKVIIGIRWYGIKIKNVLEWLLDKVV